MIRISLLFSFLFLVCQQERIIIEDTKGYIAFSRMPENGDPADYDIWVINPATSEEIQITKDLNHWECYPLWLSSSELLYLFTKPTPSATKIGYCDFSKGKRKYLNFWTREISPWTDKLSIDSSHNIYYDAYLVEEQQNAIYKMSLREENAKPLEILSPRDINQFGLAKIKMPVVSPDGSKLLLGACDTLKYRHFREMREVWNYDIYLYDLNANNMKDALKRLTHGEYNNVDPVWINNDYIVFSSNRDGNYELYLMGINTQSLKRLTFTDDVAEIEVAISPDSRHIAYSIYGEKLKKDELWIMDLETQKTWFLTEGESPDWCPAQ